MWTGLELLQYLSLEHNDIQHVGPSAFADLPNLKGLYLHSNKLKTLSSNIFSPTQMPLIEILTLHDNSLNGNELRWLHDLCENGQVQQYTIGEEDILCSSNSRNDDNSKNDDNNAYTNNVAQLEHNSQGETRFSSCM